MTGCELLVKRVFFGCCCILLGLVHGRVHSTGNCTPRFAAGANRRWGVMVALAYFFQLIALCLKCVTDFYSF